jgi:hypothetical protein
MYSKYIFFQSRNKGKQTPMPREGLKPMIPVFEQAKTVHALDRAATVIGPTSVSQHFKRFKLPKPLYALGHKCCGTLYRDRVA